MAAMTKFDDLFFGILQNCEQIEPFLEVVFSFLARKTDFFRIMRSKTDKMGFPPGVAEKMVQKIFKKYQSLVLHCEEKQSKISDGSSKERRQKSKSDTNCQPTSNVLENSLMDETMPQSSAPVVPPAVSTVDVETSNPVDKSKRTESPLDDASVDKLPKPCQSLSEALSSSQTVKSDPDINKPSITPDCFNGGITDSYMWSQTGGEVDVRVPVDSTVKGKDIMVDIKNNHLKVALKDLQGGPKVLVEGELQWKIHAEESMWTLIPGEHIHVSLDKVEDRWWTCVIKGDKEIDRSKIDTTRDISEFDEQTQCDYEKVMYDQRQKMLGKPTSEEKKTHEILKKAWDAPNSPFAGTPFDPSKVNISGNFT